MSRAKLTRMTDFSYHVATSDDVAALTDIYNAAVIRGGSTADTEPVSVEQRLQWLQAHTDPYVVFMIDAHEHGSTVPVGFGAISPFYARPGYDGVCSLAYYVAPQWQGKGAGKFTLQTLLNECQDRGMRKACTSIFGDNARSAGLAMRFGFTQYGLLPQAAYDSKGVLHDVGYWTITFAQ